MLSLVRSALHRAITTPRGDSLAPVRIPKDLARRLNVALGQPARPARGAGQARSKRGRASPSCARRARRASACGARPRRCSSTSRRTGTSASWCASRSSSAPRGYAWKRLDVAGDDATIDFVMLQAKCERDELPVVFVADRAMGGYEALVRTRRLRASSRGSSILRERGDAAPPSPSPRSSSSSPSGASRIVPARDASGCPFAGPGVDLVGDEAAAAFALAAPAAGVARSARASPRTLAVARRRPPSAPRHRRSPPPGAPRAS